MIELRDARRDDAEAMTRVQNAIFDAGLRADPVEHADIVDRYFGTEETVLLTVATDDGRVVGFQVLKRAWLGNPYDVPAGWGIIGTHIEPAAGRSGIGRRLFARSLAAAESAGLRHVDATIASDNDAGIAYYSAMGFVPNETLDGAVSYRLDIDPA